MKVGQHKKDAPADVAKDGFDAMTEARGAGIGRRGGAFARRRGAIGSGRNRSDLAAESSSKEICGNNSAPSPMLPADPGAARA
jgi:hypothetical protein